MDSSSESQEPNLRNKSEDLMQSEIEIWGGCRANSLSYTFV